MKKIVVQDPGVDWQKEPMEVYIARVEKGKYVAAIPKYTYSTIIEGGGAKLDDFPGAGHLDMEEIKKVIDDYVEGEG